MNCPHCTSENHHAVDIDGEGEAFRFCDDCGQNFRDWTYYPTAPGVACKVCGTEAVGVKAHAVGFDYCRHCYHTGQAYSDLRTPQLDGFRSALPGWTVSVEHTGGGCFWLAFYPPDAGGFFYAATAGEATLPEHEDGAPMVDGWGIACRYHWTDDDDETHPDYEGTLVLEGTPEYEDRYPEGSKTDAELVAALAADWERVRA